MLFGASRTRSGNYRIILQIGQEQLRLLVLRHSSANPPQAVVNDSIDIGDDLTATIKALLKPYEKLRLEGSPVDLVLGSNHYQTVTVDRPNLPESDLSSGIAFQLGDLVSFAPDEMVTDFYELPFYPGAANKVVAVAASKELLTNCVNAIIDNDLQVTSIAIAELQLRKLYQQQELPVLVMFPLESGDYLAQIYQQGLLCFSRPLRGLRRLSEYSAADIELGALEPLATELQRSMDFFESQLRQRSISTIHLAVNHPSIGEIKSQLQNLLAVDIEQVDYQPWMQELAEGDYSDIVTFAAALSVAPSATPSAATETEVTS